MPINQVSIAWPIMLQEKYRKCTDMGKRQNPKIWGRGRKWEKGRVELYYQKTLHRFLLHYQSQSVNSSIITLLNCLIIPVDVLLVGSFLDKTMVLKRYSCFLGVPTDKRIWTTLTTEFSPQKSWWRTGWLSNTHVLLITAMNFWTRHEAMGQESHSKRWISPTQQFSS